MRTAPGCWLRGTRRRRRDRRARSGRQPREAGMPAARAGWRMTTPSQLRPPRAAPGALAGRPPAAAVAAAPPRPQTSCAAHAKRKKSIINTSGESPLQSKSAKVHERQHSMQRRSANASVLLQCIRKSSGGLGWHAHECPAQLRCTLYGIPFSDTHADTPARPRLTLRL